MGSPANLVNFIGALEHALPADEGRQIEEGALGEQFFLEAAVEDGRHDVHFDANGAVKAEAELAQDGGDLFNIPIKSHWERKFQFLQAVLRPPHQEQRFSPSAPGPENRRR